MTVRVETTPNPLVLRFGVDDRLTSHPRVLRPDEPLGAALLGLDGVDEAFLGETFVAVTSARWSGPLEAAVIDAIGQHPPIDANDEPPPAPREGPPTLADKIEAILDWEIRPAVASHGGDVRLVEVSDGVARLALRGACASCPSSWVTLTQGIETRLLGALPELEGVEQVPP